MNKLPSKLNSKWGWILLLYFVVVFASFFAVQALMKLNIGEKSLMAYMVIASLSALIVCAGGFLGARIYFITASAGLAVGLLYMLYIAIFNVSPGWGDLTSIAGYFFFMLAGLVAGLVAEAFFHITKAVAKK